MIEAKDARANTAECKRLEKSRSVTQSALEASSPPSTQIFWEFSWEPADGRRDQHAMREIIIIASLGLLVVVVGIYVYLAEKARRKSDQASRRPWDKF